MKTNDKGEFVLRTKKIDSYFRGKILLWNDEFSVVCVSYCGGTPPILDILDYRAKTKEKIFRKIKKFKAKWKLISTE